MIYAILELLGLRPKRGEYLESFRGKNFKVAIYLDAEHAYLCVYHSKTETWSRVRRYDDVRLALKAARYTNEKALESPNLTLDQYIGLYANKFYGLIGLKNV